MSIACKVAGMAVANRDAKICAEYELSLYGEHECGSGAQRNMVKEP